MQLTRMRTAIAATFAVLCIGTLGAVSAMAATDDYMYSIDDVTHIQQICAEFEEPEKYASMYDDYDVDGDGDITIQDATLIQMHCAELIDIHSDDFKSKYQKVTYITIVKQEIVLGAGETYTIKIKTDASHIDYKSLNQSIAVVDSNGKITGLNPGKAVIECKAGKYTAKCNVTVLDTPTNLSLSVSNSMPKVGHTLTVTAKAGNGAKLTKESIKWKVSSSVMKIESTGDDTLTVKAMTLGSAIITVESFNGKTASYELSVSDTDTYCIDISSWQGNDVDFNKIKAAGIDYVIIRVGYGKETSQIDKQFNNYYTGAKAAGLKVGAYWFSYSTTVQGGYDEAYACLDCLNGKQLDMPVYYDLEYLPAIQSLSKNQYTQMTLNFCSTLQNAGYRTGVYTGYYEYRDSLDKQKLIDNDNSIWIALWSSSCSMPCDIWQYTDKGRINGISTDVDMDRIYNLYIAEP